MNWSPGKEQKFSEIQPISMCKSNQETQIYLILIWEYVEIENEAGGLEITTDNQGKYIFVKFWDP